MQKLLGACLLLVILAALQTTAFAGTINCKFKSDTVEGVETISMNETSVLVNGHLEIPLEHTRIKCGNFGRQHRFDGKAQGLQVILKTCTDKAELEGHMIDAQNEVVADLICD